MIFFIAEPFHPPLAQLSNHNTSRNSTSSSIGGSIRGTNISNINNISSTSNKILPSDQKSQLLQEEWFHRSISRKEAESLLEKVITNSSQNLLI